MNPLSCTFIVICSLSFVAAGGKAADARSWAERMAASEMKRRSDSLMYGKNPKARWAYETGVLLKGLEAVGDRTGNAKYYDYLKAIIGSYLAPDGSIQTCKIKKYNLDNINCRKLVLELYQQTGEDKYRKAALLLMKQLENHPRTREGGFWHKQIYPYQIWLDGIYMASPFLAQYARLFDRPANFDEAANQILWIENHTRDPRTGLLYHGWDESCAQDWADPQTGRSKNFWGWAMGWYAMGIADVLDFFPENHARRGSLVDVLGRLARAVANYQDKATGLWYQVVDQGSREKNYLEASASSMFVYALAKGVRKGYLGREYALAANRGYEGLVKHLVKADADGEIHLTQICSVAGLGGPEKWDGSFDYYVSEPIVANDLEGVGAFLMAAIEVDRLATDRK